MKANKRKKGRHNLPKKLNEEKVKFNATINEQIINAPTIEFERLVNNTDTFGCYAWVPLYMFRAKYYIPNDR